MSGGFLNLLARVLLRRTGDDTVSIGRNDRQIYFDITGAAGTIRALRLMSNGVQRWQIRAHSDAELGFDAGSTLYFNAQADDGSFIGTVFSVVRASGGTIAIRRPIQLTLNGATLTFFRTATKVIDPPSIPANSFVFDTVIVTGAAPGDFVEVVSDGALDNNLSLSGRVTGANTVTVFLRNLSAGAIDPVSQTFRVLVKRIS